MNFCSDDEEIEKDILKLQLHSIPLNLNWEQNEEVEESDDGGECSESQPAFPHAPPVIDSTDNQPSTSQTGTSEVVTDEDANNEESDDEELIDLSSHFSPTPVNLLKLNFAYQEVIEQQIVTVDRLLQENRFKMSIINESMERSKKLVGKAPKLESALFNKLFFKDDNGFGPTNPDLERIRAEVGHGFTANIIPAPKWKKPTDQKLREGIKRCAQRNLMEPLYTQLEHLQEKLEVDQPSPDHVTMTEKKIAEVKQKLKDAKDISLSQLISDRKQDFDWESIANLELESQQNAINCELHWKNSLHPSINHSSWTSEEDKKLAMLLGKHKNHDWRIITEELGTNRTIMDVVRRYQLKINTSFRSRPWTPEEDAYLMRLVKKYRVGDVIPYTQIALHMKNRYATQIVFRWTKTLDPSYKHTRFTPEEDAALLRAVRFHGEKWSRIRDLGLVPGRNDAQLRERFKNALEHCKSTWTEEDDEILLKVVEEVGVGNWVAIAKKVPQRTDCQCLRRWTAIMKNKNKGKKMTYRTPSIKSSRIYKIRKKLRSAINNEDTSVNEESSDSSSPAKPTRGMPDAKKMSSEEVLEVYSNVASQERVAYVHKRPPRPEEELKCEDEIYKLIGSRYRPLMARAQKDGGPVWSTLSIIRETSKSITAKDIFIHFIKALNVNAEETLESIKRKTISTRKTRVSGRRTVQSSDRETAPESDASPNRGSRRSSSHAIGGKETESDQSAKKNVKSFSRNLYLPLCAPNFATVRAYRDLTKDRERRVTKAKSILRLDHLNEEKGSGSGKGESPEKHQPEELLANLRATYKYKIFRSRFNALMTWPTLLASLVPYKRRLEDGMLYPAVKTQRVAKTDEDDPPPAKKTKFV